MKLLQLKGKDKTTVSFSNKYMHRINPLSEWGTRITSCKLYETFKEVINTKLQRPASGPNNDDQTSTMAANGLSTLVIIYPKLTKCLTDSG